MATGKYTRIDNNRRSSSGYCSTVTVVVFVGLCLVGVWMMTSSSVVPNGGDGDVTHGSKHEVKEHGSESGKEGNNTPQFEDNPGDLPEDATKEDQEKSQEKIETGDGEKKSDDSESKAESSEEKPESAGGEGDSEESSTDKKSFSDVSGTKSDSDSGEKKSDSDEGEKNSDSDDGDKKSDSDEGEKKSDSDEGEKKSDSDEDEKKTDSDESDKKSDSDDGEKKSDSDEVEKKSDSDDSEKNEDGQGKNQNKTEDFPSGAQSDLLNETTAETGSWSTQSAVSKNEKAQLKNNFNWKLCNVTAGPDFIPCLDNLDAIKHLNSTKHYEHRERHCPEEPPTCLVSLPEGYKRSIKWPKSREKIWYSNVPHTKLAQVKGHQNWVKVTGEYLTFPGGGTQFKHGALHYIDFIQESVSDVAWGKRSRVVLDVGCGVASFGGYLFDRDVLTMSLAPKDEHEAQVQFALERGIPAISAVMGTKRLPFPGRVFDVVHCARCRVPWHIEGGKLLLELNRLLRPGGFFIWSATPIYQKLPEDVEIWEAMKKMTKQLCWETISIIKDTVNGVGIAIYKKPTSNECYEKRSKSEPPLCASSDDPNAAWNVPLEACMHKAPVDEKERGSQWPEKWPARVSTTPYWLLSSQTGVYGKPAPEDFAADFEHWKRVVNNSYLKGMGIDWSSVRNVMDMRAIYGGFAAALKDLNIWVMNVVSIDSADTLPIIFERGLFGIYHDWCESFSTYPRTYDLLHADHLFSRIRKRCNIVALLAEADRILRPEGKLIVRDDAETINELENLAKSMHWEVRMTFSKNNEGLLCVQKSMWRPKEQETLKYAI